MLLKKHKKLIPLKKINFYFKKVNKIKIQFIFNNLQRNFKKNIKKVFNNVLNNLK